MESSNEPRILVSLMIYDHLTVLITCLFSSPASLALTSYLINPASLRSHDRMSARPSFTCCCARVSYVWQYDCTVGTKLCGFVLAVMAVMC